LPISSIKTTFDISKKDSNLLCKLNTFFSLLVFMIIIGLFAILWAKLINPFIFEFLVQSGLIYYFPKPPSNEIFEFDPLDIVIGLGFISFVSMKEELMFRFYLHKSKLIFFTGLALLLVGSVFQFGIIGLYVLQYIVLIYLLRFLKVHTYYLIFTSALIFGAYHYSNFGYFEFRNPIAFLFLPIICIGQTLGGIVFGIARIKLGITWTVLLHIIVNLFFVSLALKMLN
jgi:hypothetical protein